MVSLCRVVVRGRVLARPNLVQRYSFILGCARGRGGFFYFFREVRWSGGKPTPSPSLKGGESGGANEFDEADRAHKANGANRSYRADGTDGSAFRSR